MFRTYPPRGGVSTEHKGCKYGTFNRQTSVRKRCPVVFTPPPPLGAKNLPPDRPPAKKMAPDRPYGHLPEKAIRSGRTQVCHARALPGPPPSPRALLAPSSPRFAIGPRHTPIGERTPSLARSLALEPGLPAPSHQKHGRALMRPGATVRFADRRGPCICTRFATSPLEPMAT